MDDDEFANTAFELIQKLLRGNSQTVPLADEILDEANQGTFERKGLQAPRYDVDADSGDLFGSGRRQRKSRQQVTVSVPLTSAERALVAANALRRAFIEPREIARHLAHLNKIKAVAPLRKRLDVNGREQLVPNPLERFDEGASGAGLKLSFEDPRRNRETSFRDYSVDLENVEISRLEAILLQIEERLT